MPDVRNQAGGAATVQDELLRANGHRDLFWVRPSRCFQEIDNRLFDLIALISVGNQVDILALVLEDASLQHLGPGLWQCRQQLPITAAGKERLHTVSRTPIEVVDRVFSIAQRGSYGHDS